MKFHIFRIIWMLFIQRIQTKPTFKISAVEREIEICNGRQNSESWPHWTIQANLSVTETELKGFTDPVEIYLKLNSENTIYEKLCEIKIGDISKGKCPPPIIQWNFNTSCYCASSGTGWYHLKITRRSYFYENEGLIWIKFPFGEFKDTLPVTILAKTCFCFQQPGYGVTTTGTIQTGDFWYAIGYLEITLADKSSYGSEVQVDKDDVPYCTIDLTHCPPKEMSTGDIICYCEGKNQFVQFMRYRLKVRAKAQTSQSKANLSAELESTSEGAALTDYIGTLPTIEEKPTTITRKSEIKSLGTTLSTIEEKRNTTTKKSEIDSQGTSLSAILEQNTTGENTTKEISSNYTWLLIQILFVVGACFTLLCFMKCKNRKRKLSSDSSYREHEKTKRKHEKSKREHHKSKRKHETSEREPTNSEKDYLPTKYKGSSYFSESRIMEGSLIDPPSYGAHSKIDSKSFTLSQVSNFDVEL